MRCLRTISCALVLSAAAAALAEQGEPAFAPGKDNAARLRWLQYRMVAGRVVATSTYPEGMNISFGPSTVGGRYREHLQLLILKDRASVRYELAGVERHLAIALSESGAFSIRRVRVDPAITVHFLQQPGESVRLSLVEDGDERLLQAESFWHLYLAEPELVRQHVIPYLELLRPNWRLDATGAALERALFEQARNPQALDTKRWSRLVDALASANFSERENAERELRRIGQVVLPYLEGLDRQHLDAEQAARIRQVIAALRVDYEDRNDRIAAWLAGDKQVWLSLLARDDEAKRRAAAQQLEVLVGGPIPFDPAADAATREAQLARLRQRQAGTWQEKRRSWDDGGDNDAEE